MAAREPFTDKDIQHFREALEHCKTAMREIDRAERVGVNVDRYRADMREAEKKLAAVIHEYGDDTRP